MNLFEMEEQIARGEPCPACGAAWKNLELQHEPDCGYLAQEEACCVEHGPFTPGLNCPQCEEVVGFKGNPPTPPSYATADERTWRSF